MTEFIFEHFCNCAMDHCEVPVQYTSVHRCVKLINIVIKEISVNFVIDNLRVILRDKPLSRILSRIPTHFRAHVFTYVL